MSDPWQHHGLQLARLLCPLGFSRQEHWSGLPCPPPEDLPNPGIKPRSLALQADSLPYGPPGKPYIKPNVHQLLVQPRTPKSSWQKQALLNDASKQLLCTSLLGISDFIGDSQRNEIFDTCWGFYSLFLIWWLLPIEPHNLKILIIFFSTGNNKLWKYSKTKETKDWAALCSQLFCEFQPLWSSSVTQIYHDTSSIAPTWESFYSVPILCQVNTYWHLQSVKCNFSLKVSLEPNTRP